MDLSPLYKEQLAKAEQEGFQQGLQLGERATALNLLRFRFGALDEQLNAIVDNVLLLPSEEFMPLLLQLSREELLARFKQE
ncbi:MAG: hypothetical protein H0X31_08400 [Nostocaceae cyanobacterium]|nr:hypothetical protein [Nostocaceae cyanobacterium]